MKRESSRKVLSILLIAFMTLAMIPLLTTQAGAAAAESARPLSANPCDFDEDVTQYLDDVSMEGDSIVDYNLTDYHGGTWCDAEKTLDNTDDDLMCWAAAASNVLEWTGWGYVEHSTDGAMTNCDDMFAHFNAHWEDQGSLTEIGWMWWFDGDDGLPGNYPNDPPYIGGPGSWSEVDVPGGGEFWTPPYNLGTYFHEYSGSQTLQHIDSYLHSGWGVALGIYDGGHAITCWGFEYDDTVDKTTNPEDYYLGLYITDSDDNKHQNSWDPPDDRIRYYSVSYNSGINRWVFDTYGGGGWHIEIVFALEPFPNTAPEADANGPYTGDEGDIIVFDGSGSSDPDDNPLRYRWDFDNDGTWDTAWSSNPYVSHTYPDDYSGLAVLEVSDYITTDTDTADITIYNVAPSVNAGPDQTANEGDTVSFSGDFTDPGSDDTHTIEWDFGDGSTTLGTLTPIHVYGDNGLYTVTLTVTDDDGGVGTDTLTVTVNNVAPSITELAMTPPNPDNPEYILPNVHEPLFTAPATDPGSDDLTFTWDWDDGTGDTTIYYNDGVGADPYPSPWGTYPFSATNQTGHIYSEPGTYTVTLTVEDDDGGVDTATYEIKILSAEEAKHIIDYYIQALADDAFKNNPNQRKKSFNNMFSAIDDMLSGEEYEGVIAHLRHNIREKADGTVDGSPKNDWITDATAQEHICWKIDALIAYLETLI